MKELISSESQISDMPPPWATKATFCTPGAGARHGEKCGSRPGHSLTHIEVKLPPVGRPGYCREERVVQEDYQLRDEPGRTDGHVVLPRAIKGHQSDSD